MFLLGPTQLKKKFSFYFYFNCVLIKKIKRRSLDDVTKNSVFVVARLRNHGKYSHCWIDFVCDDIAHSLME
jgi:hypothetical protein